MNQENPWKNLATFVTISSPWLTIIGEKFQDNQGKLIDYWRVEKADSVVIITQQNHQFLFPKLMYRPGLQKNTLDFPGGRLPTDKQPREVIPEILQRELGINEVDIIDLIPLNPQGWAINSSFSNQKLYGFFAEISPKISVVHEKLAVRYSLAEVDKLLADLTCLQCRAVLLEWLNSQG